MTRYREASRGIVAGFFVSIGLLLLAHGGAMPASGKVYTQAEVLVDGTAPSSAVNALPEIELTTSFEVSWSGQDNEGGSGIKDYDVQYRDSAGAWTDWVTATTDTSGTFAGEFGHTYYFQCRARDKAGNVEAYPGGDGDTHTAVDDGPPTITIAKPAGDGEYVSGTTFVKAYVTDPSGVSWARVYVDNEYAGEMYQEGDYWRYDLSTSAYQKGTHELKIGAEDDLGHPRTETRGVYCRPGVTLTGISFLDGHALWYMSGVPAEDAQIEPPQYVPGAPNPVTRPFAYTAGAQMSVFVGMSSTDITVPVQVMYMVGATWKDRNGNVMATDYREKWTPDAVTFPVSLAHYPPTPDRVTNYVLDQSYDLYVRRYMESEWCWAGEANVTHPQAYLTFGPPIGPWGHKTLPNGQQVERTCWSAILDFACQRMPDNGYANTSSGKLEAREQLTDGAYWWCFKNYDGGDTHCATTTFHMWTFLCQGWADCRDMSAYWVKLCNGLGMNAQARRIWPSAGYDTFLTRDIDPVGQPSWTAANWSFHQVGHYENLFDSCIRLRRNGDPDQPWIAKDADVGGHYKVDLLAPQQDWSVDTPFSLLEVD